MSYCVNCGVRLEKTMTLCPLCHTPVYHPEDPPDTHSLPPFPADAGEVEMASRKQSYVFLATLFLSTSLACALLNALVFRASLWSVYVIGSSLLAGIFLLPLLTDYKHAVSNILLDGAGTALFLFVIYKMHPYHNWFLLIALPVVIMLTLSALSILMVIKRCRIRILRVPLVLCTDLAIFCVVLELLIRIFMKRPLGISWSAIVLTTSIVLVIMLYMLLRMRNLRKAIARRLQL